MLRAHLILVRLLVSTCRYPQHLEMIAVRLGSLPRRPDCLAMSMFAEDLFIPKCAYTGDASTD